MMRIVVSVLLLCITFIARADGVSDAKLHYEKGIAAFGLDHFAEAAEEYEKAFSAKPDPALLYNAAQAHRLAGNSERALKLYQNFLRMFGKRASNRDEVERHITELQAAIAVQKKAQNSPPITTAEPENTPPTTTIVPPSTPPSTPEVVVTTPPPASRGKPLYKKAWFWGVIGGVVVVGAGLGVGLGLGLRTHYLSTNIPDARLQ